MIEVQHVSKRYGEVVALSDVSFTAKKGEVLGFLGANGAGKTTTMDILCGCIGADGGSVKIGGNEVSEAPEVVKAKLGYLPDEPPLHNDMLVSEYIDYAARLRGIKSADVPKRVDEMVERLALGDVRNRLVGNLSKGFRQRVGLAQALVHNPDVLILDEPTEGLDPTQIVQIRDMIRSFKGEHTIIYSSHILSEVENICDQLVVIDKGRVIEQGSYAELLRKMEGSRRYRLRVASDVGRLLQQLSGNTRVVAPQLSENAENVLEFGVQTGDDEILGVVAKAAIEGGFGFRELAQHTKSLEQIYFQLTKKS